LDYHQISLPTTAVSQAGFVPSGIGDIVGSGIRANCSLILLFCIHNKIPAAVKLTTFKKLFLKISSLFTCLGISVCFSF